MWLCFDSNGALIEPALQHGKAARAGTTDFQIFAYFQGVDLAVNSLATIKFFKPDLTHSSYPLLAMRRVDMPYVKKEGENSSCFAEDGGPHGDGIYPGFLFDFSNFSGDQDVSILLDTPGLWEGVISLYSIDRVISVQGIATFNVQYGNISVNGVEVPFDEIMASFAAEIGGKLDIKKGIVSVDNINLVDTDNYSEGQMFYDKNTSTLYELTEGHMVPVSSGGGGGSEIKVVELSGTLGELSGTQAQALIENNTIILDENGYVYRKSCVQNNGTIIYQRMVLGETIKQEIYTIYTASDTYIKSSIEKNIISDVILSVDRLPNNSAGYPSGQIFYDKSTKEFYVPGANNGFNGYDIHLQKAINITGTETIIDTFLPTSSIFGVSNWGIGRYNNTLLFVKVSLETTPTPHIEYIIYQLTNDGELKYWKNENATGNETFASIISSSPTKSFLEIYEFSGITYLNDIQEATGSKPFILKFIRNNKTDYYLARVNTTTESATTSYHAYEFEIISSTGAGSKIRYQGAYYYDGVDNLSPTLNDALRDEHRADFLIEDNQASGYLRKVNFNIDNGHTDNLETLYLAMKSSSANPVILYYLDRIYLAKLYQGEAGESINNYKFYFEELTTGKIWSLDTDVSGATTLYSILYTDDYLTRESFDCKLNDYLTRYYINIFVNTQDHSFVPLRFNGLISGNKQQIFTYFKNAVEQASTMTGVTVPEITDTATLNNAINLIVNALLAAGTTEAREGALMLLAALGAYDTCGSIQTHNFTSGIDTTSNFVRTVYGGGGYALPYVINDENNQVQLLSVGVLIDYQLTALQATAVEVQVVIPGVE